MRVFYEWGTTQLRKHGEELCGDSIAVSRHSDSVTLALSDGLGSGVKANILATLTTRIAMRLLESDLSLGEVVQTLSETLPVCQVRKMAYSTFAIAQFFSDGHARIVEFDSPAAIVLRGRKQVHVAYEERCIEGKNIREAVLTLADGDWIAFVSDGVVNAGIGGLYPLGWGWEQVARFLERHAHPALRASELAEKAAEAVRDLYADSPGDDVSVVVVKARRKRVATVLTGPPADRARDALCVAGFLKRGGRLAVCGGTTAKLVARHSGRALEVDLSTATPDVPAAARIEGIDVATEGILTLTQARRLLQAGVGMEECRFANDGASSLLRMMFEVDHVRFLVGQAVNPAHQNPDLPHQLEIRLAVVRDIAHELRGRGIDVDIEIV
ncbi:MAG: SpoIIE family protein phosphatase [Kiritimatiellae bacterium]|nr:SpoIIE family protein phosphatase [Kiritimatiellia bacterium]